MRQGRGAEDASRAKEGQYQIRMVVIGLFPYYSFINFIVCTNSLLPDWRTAI